MSRRVVRCWLFVVSCWIGMGAAVAQTGAGAAFEVATIRPTNPVNDGHTHINYPTGGVFNASNITLAALMEWAYQMPQKQILDGPAWMGTERFDVQAKSDAATDKRLRGMSSEDERALKRRMVQALLEDRFALKTHRETRTLAAYDLVVGKEGSKLQVSTANGKSIGMGREHFNGEGLTMVIIAEELSLIAGKIVVDKTGLEGRYDLKLKWTPDDAVVAEDSAPSLFTAIEEQLGLKLKAAKEPVAVIAVDAVAQPSPN
jgi:uncharacterized protein (TIGR03435 family)